jgi:protein phosphatase
MTNLNPSPVLHAYGDSYVGKRQQNEDRFAVTEPTDPEKRARRGCLYVVCDGMGGHAAGEVASKIAVETVIQGYFDDPGEIGESLDRAIRWANARVYAASQENDLYEGMGSTLVACLVRAHQAWIAHVGDSRAYRLRNGALEQLTQDHLYVIETLGLDEEAASHHHLKSRLSRAVGLQAEIKVDIAAIDLEVGDEILLCSDGLTNVLTEEGIAAQLGQSHPRESVNRLLDIARAQEADDNTTALVISYRPDDSAPTSVNPDVTEEGPPDSTANTDGRGNKEHADGHRGWQRLLHFWDRRRSE